MKQIITNGITYLDALPGSKTWYWGMDYTHGDLYEAEELFRYGNPIQQNRLILVRYPEGTVYEPVHPEPGQYLGRPVYHNGQVVFLLVDFPRNEIRIMGFDNHEGQATPIAVLPLSVVEDCYNLLLHTPPLMLTRTPNDNKFQILWPEQREFVLEDRESFEILDGDKMYTTVWHEDPDYREETLVRDYATGKPLERMPGSLLVMPDGQQWNLV